MCSDETDIYKLRCKLNDNNQTVIVPFDVEYIMLIAYAIHTIECLLDISETFPLAFFDNRHSFLKRHLCVGVLLDVFIQLSFREYSHKSFVYSTKV